MSARVRPSSGPHYAGGRFYKSSEHYTAARGARGDYASTGFSFHIDTREIDKLRRALVEAGVGYKRSETILAQSLNRAGDRIRTQLKRSIQQWTGIRRQGEITKRMFPVRASAGNMKAGVTVTGRHFRVTTADFGAAWRRSWPGGRHSAWNRPQTADGSFMAMKGRGSAYGGGLLFKRTSKKRLPIKPLWGPHPVREMQRHEGLSRAIVVKEAQWFIGESTRRAEVELKKAKAKYGL